MSYEEKHENGSQKRGEKRYITVARQLARAKDFTPTKDLADRLKMEPFKFSASVQRAKEFLATHGIMMANKNTGKKGEIKGYKRATIQEFEAEIFKSCSRAAAHIHQSFKIIAIVEASGKVDADFGRIKSVLSDNIKSIDFPIVDKSVLKRLGGGKPKFLDDIANEET